MASVLLIDDDPALLEVVGMALTDEGYVVVSAPNGAEGFALLERSAIDLVVSDVNMPRLDGFALCRKIREHGILVPLVLLTSRDSEIDEALGLELGADDYIAKPFSTRVLLARISALLRRERARSGPRTRATDMLESGRLALDVERLQATYARLPMSLTLSEFRLLEALARRPGIVLSRDRLLQLVRGDDSVVAERIVDTYIRRLRRKFEAIDPTAEPIETVIGAGYRWRE